MPTNQRKNARKERSRKNEAKTRKIIWAVLIFVIIVLIIMRVCEIDFASLKNRFTVQTEISLFRLSPMKTSIR